MANSPNSSRLLMCFALLLSALLTTACGGGASVSLAGVGSGGTGYGVSTGFGSLIIDGMRHNDTAASYWSEQEQGPAMAMAPTGATVGHSMEYSYDASGDMLSVLVSPELLGTVTALGPNRLTLLGTTVLINADAAAGPVTRLLGYASLADVKAGDRVEVHGLLKTDSQGATTLQATLIVAQPSVLGVRLTGYVSQYNASAGSFVIGATTVKLGSASVSPAGATPANGDLVTVWSNTDPVANVLSAGTVRIKRLGGAAQNLTVSGLISSFTSAASFRLRNLVIDASKAEVLPSGSTLGADKYVLVTGTLDASGNSVTATAVTVFTAAAPTTVELHGTVANFVSASSFTLRGVALDASAATFSGGTPAQLGNGVFVDIRGSVVNNVVRASSVTIQALTPLQAPSGAVLDVSGTVTAYNATSGTYSLTLASGVTLSGKLHASMFYNNGNASNLVVGQAISVHGVLSDGLLSTSVMNFSAMSATPPNDNLHMEGAAYNVTANSFMLNGVLIQSKGVAVQGAGAMGGRNMMPGSTIAVDLRLIGGQYVASAITLLH